VEKEISEKRKRQAKLVDVQGGEEAFSSGLRTGRDMDWRQGQGLTCGLQSRYQKKGFPSQARSSGRGMNLRRSRRLWDNI
jgi:hypothetical protein